MITKQDIKRAQQFSKIYSWINVPLKKKPLTPDVIASRERRARSTWAAMFRTDPALWNQVQEGLTNLRAAA